jgi:hypothetical protein
MDNKVKSTPEPGSIPEPELPITMCCFGGMFIMGRITLTNSLLSPRIFNLVESMEPDSQGIPHRVVQYQLAPIPGFPSRIDIANMFFSYPVSDADANLLELYNRVIRVTKPAAHGDEQPKPKPSPLNREPSNIIKLH